MNFVKNRSYFISQPSVVLYEKNSNKSEALNHLIFGDWVKYLGSIKGAWCKVYSRGNTGWILKKQLSDKRALEINFVDIGQGDSVHMVTPDDKAFLIDAGKTDNLYRFLQWRYNLRGRKVAGVDGVSTSDPLTQKPVRFHAAIISHPDKDHYYGFKNIFSDPKISFEHVYHNGIVERPVSKDDKLKVKNIPQVSYFYDLGRAVKDGGRGSPNFVYDTIHNDKDMRSLIKKHKDTRKDYIGTLVELVNNPSNKKTKFKSLTQKDGYLPDYGKEENLEIEILGPITEKRAVNGKMRECFRILNSDEGETKNGHSIIMRMKIGKLRILLGGDLNTASEDFLFKQYTNTLHDISDIEKQVFELQEKGTDRTAEETQLLESDQALLESLVLEMRKTFQVDVTKACHHGSHHFSESFLRALNAIATVISSGDSENYSHPRPDALGAFGKYGRGHRPLIFSTEIARSTREFTPIFKYFNKLESFKAKIAAAKTKREQNSLQKEMEEAKDSNVARYGMITLRTDGETTIMATKLEVESGPGAKWDIHKLVFNENTNSIEYYDKTKHH